MLSLSRCVGLGLALGILSVACSDDSEGATQGSESSGATCMPGQEGCPCAPGNACVVGLACVSNACIDPSGVSSGTSGTSGASGGSTSGGSSAGSASGTSAGDSGPAGACEATDECGVDEICVEGYCQWIGDLFFEVTVHEFDPPDCADGWGGAELYYDYYEGGDLVLSSTISGCPGTWSDETFTYDSLKSFYLAFWDSDAIDDDWVTGLCWSDPCGPVPYSILREGWWSGLDGTGTYFVSLSFVPVTAVGVLP